MMSRRRLIAVMVVGLLLAIGGAAVFTYKAYAADPECDRSGERRFGRLQHCGYFDNNLTLRQGYSDVISGGVLRDSRYDNNFDVDAFMSQVQGGGRGGEFLRNRMTDDGPHTWDELRRRVTRYKNSGKINISRNNASGCSWTTYHQINGIRRMGTDDVAWYQPCVNASNNVIKFGDEFIIDRECGNARDKEGPLKKTVAWQATISNVSSDTRAVEPNAGTINFEFRIHNNNNDDSTDQTGAESDDLACKLQIDRVAGYAPQNSSPGYNGGWPGAPDCASHLNPGSDKTVNFTYNVNNPGDLNHTICMTFGIDNKDYNSDRGPNPSDGQMTRQQCAYVVAKPYVKMFSGDVSVGSQLESGSGVCSATYNAGVTSWNKGSGAGYAGAGVQYALFAYAAISEFASAQNIAGASAPRGLTFANSAGEYGGGFGSANCIADYYRRMPSTAQVLSTGNVSAIPNGSYRASGNTVLSGGNVNPNNKVTIYVDGNLYITGNINYVGRWDLNTLPLFQVVVRGNIYIDNDVTRLDGIFIAQRHPGGDGLMPTADDYGGTIYTCTTAAAPLTPDGGLFGACRNKLTINGAFVAYSVQFLRTGGGLYLSRSNETSNSGGAGNDGAEVFNYNAAAWLVQQPPETDSRLDSYDSIANLPPVL